MGLWGCAQFRLQNFLHVLLGCHHYYADSELSRGFVFELGKKLLIPWEGLLELLVQAPLTNAASMTRALFIFRPRQLPASSTQMFITTLPYPSVSH
jgi:hypothetical protein